MSALINWEINSSSVSCLFLCVAYYYCTCVMWIMIYIRTSVVQKQVVWVWRTLTLHIHELLCFMVTFSRVGESFTRADKWRCCHTVGFQTTWCRCVLGELCVEQSYKVLHKQEQQQRRRRHVRLSGWNKPSDEKYRQPQTFFDLSFEM